ncbi:Transcriptional activator hap3 [Colletotrichum sidae]|uniref:Transcriptional activator hap3 n=1 Tax=Colletotrichum sidae TaxID=1347389 RepID=A0A4R8TF11_9PEZI|nr:Transcriptional activator hap3 [Colletotrichum sidae]
MSDSPQSPPKDVEQGVQSPEEEQMNEPQDPQAGLAYAEFEVKEQDRWLPIANGKPNSPFSSDDDATTTTTTMFDFWGSCAPAISIAVFQLVRTVHSGAAAVRSSVVMSHDSSSKSPEAAVASGGEKYDELDANIRNFAPVARIMKNALPENAKIAKEAKECMQECVSEFISFITSEASEKCHQEKRKTVNGEDILFAMTSLGFENYAEALKIYLSKYREQQSQSNRGESAHRPGSSGYGANPPTGAGSFQAEPQNNVLGGQQGDAAAAQNYMYGAQTGHNGTGGTDDYQ